VTPDIDVVIVTFDSRDMTSDCVAALDDPRIARVVVVDNGSTDGTAVALRERFGERVEIVPLEPPRGFAAACNAGAAAGDASLVLFLNSDILTVAGGVSRLAEELERDSGAVAAGGRLVNPGDLTTQDLYKPRRFPGLAVLATTLLGIEERWPANPVTRRHVGADLDESATHAVEQPAAAALLVRRDVFESIGGFDERFWFWYEDIDLLNRLHARGRVLWVPSAPFRHVGGASFAKWDKVKQIRSLYHGIVHYGDAQLARPKKALLGLLVVLVALPRVVFFGRSRPDEAAAWREILRAGGALVLGRRPRALAGGA
jgi:N-acetylglucosaminyl-diphospho-decaprenol L-rhamnosyltransferase